jgi:hypothetical protein
MSATLVKKFPAFREPDDLLPSSQETDPTLNF